MRGFIKIISILFFISTLTSSVTARKPRTLSELRKANEGQIFYTRFSLFHEYGLHSTTNYRRGKFLPVNTPVSFIKSEDNQIFITLPDDEEIALYNFSKYSGENLNGIFTRTLSTSKTDISKFTEAEQKAIRTGNVKVGMSKAAVLVAIGYPPKHKTPSLEEDNWRYWCNRFGSFVVEFENDTVVNIDN